MTPKEKAEELFLKNLALLAIFGLKPNPAEFIAKKCALITVNEIIKGIRKGIPKIGFGTGYWSDVRKAIKKL